MLRDNTPRARTRRTATFAAPRFGAARPTHTGEVAEGRGLHVAIIMDGSGRWAEARHRPRLDGHRAGAASVRRIVDASPRLGVETLTLFAFSSDNWKRPASEVSALMELLRGFLVDFQHDASRTGVCIDVIGRRDRLAPALLEAIDSAEDTTREGRALHLRLAVDYSGREAIARAAQEMADAQRGAPEESARGESERRDAFRSALATVVHACRPAPEVDLLIRTGGEQRLSDFLLWECAYAELYFTPRKWPEFGVGDMQAALRDFRARDRRFGSLSHTSTV